MDGRDSVMNTTHSSPHSFTRPPRPGEVFEDGTVPVEVMDPPAVVTTLFNGMLTSHKEPSAKMNGWDRDRNQLLVECESGTIHCLNFSWANEQNRKFQEAVLGGKETFIPYYFTLAMQNIMVISLINREIKIKYPWWLIVNPKPEWWTNWVAMFNASESEQPVVVEILLMHGFTFCPGDEVRMSIQPSDADW